jgi:hypothetical protein
MADHRKWSRLFKEEVVDRICALIPISRAVPVEYK